MSDYWERRALDRLSQTDLIGDDYQSRILDLYKKSFDELNGDLNELFDRYISQGAITPTEAISYLRDPVSRAKADEIMRKLGEVIDPDERRRLLAQANSGQVSARMSRLRAMQENIKAECAKIADKEIAIHQEAARKVGYNAYYRTLFDVQQGVNAAVPFAQITIEKIDAVLARKWAGENYSSRVWDNTSSMAQKLGEIVRTNVASGRSWERCVDEIKLYMTSPDQGGYYAAARLLRTETMHVYNEMSAQASRSMGARRYRFIAVLDLKTSPTCRLHDGLVDPDTGKFYTYAKRKVGVNFPPLHPWCRSIEAPYINKSTLAGLSRPAKHPLTGKIERIPADMTYQEWYKERVLTSPDAKVKEKMMQHTATDRDQWMRYSEVMEDMPISLADFQRKKYTNPEWWKITKQRYRDIRTIYYPF